MREATEKNRVIMLEAIFEVFEKMLFIFLEPSTEKISGLDLGASISFQDDKLQGEMRLLFSTDLAVHMAQNILNPEDGRVTEEQIEDCVKEAVNMVCGNYLSKLDPRRVFDLAIPVFLKKPGKTVSGDQAFRLDFASDDGPLCFMMGSSVRR
ncbi:MAG: chemotaxis protein CheX [Syntrophales bacterium]|mgnify:CR=1 FL=1|nr:chemotaxis protein CheX [Syntrophales bacterium]MDD5231885.1 chemotaxis protein CheX [Syntrophales bacterium]HPL63818.1 chemotaxis protein CheX [Syntrophales bacterium]